MGQLRISAKNLGAIALADFCPRCFWIKLKMGNKLPYQIFPGIFSTLDSYSKKVIDSWVKAHGTLPSSLSSLGDVVESIKPLHHSRFFIEDEKTNIKLTGDIDAVFRTSDNAYLIIDYKTAKFTKTQDRLLPMYEVQLNAYCTIGKQHGIDPVQALYLVYTEPSTNFEDSEYKDFVTEDGFMLNFVSGIRPVEINPKLVDWSLEQARTIYDLIKPPDGREGCKDCGILEQLFAIAK